MISGRGELAEARGDKQHRRKEIISDFDLLAGFHQGTPRSPGVLPSYPPVADSAVICLVRELSGEVHWAVTL